jgi:hypothetical protein
LAWDDPDAAEGCSRETAAAKQVTSKGEQGVLMVVGWWHHRHYFDLFAQVVVDDDRCVEGGFVWLLRVVALPIRLYVV